MLTFVSPVFKDFDGCVARWSRIVFQGAGFWPFEQAFWSKVPQTLSKTLSRSKYRRSYLSMSMTRQNTSVTPTSYRNKHFERQMVVVNKKTPGLKWISPGRREEVAGGPPNTEFDDNFAHAKPKLLNVLYSVILAWTRSPGLIYMLYLSCRFYIVYFRCRGGLTSFIVVFWLGLDI